MGEAGQPIIGCDLNGQGFWGLANRVAFDGGHISLATDCKTLWVASEGKRSIIYRVDMSNGKYSPWNSLNREGASEFRVLDLAVSELPGVGADAKLGVNLAAIALNKGTLAVCLTREDQDQLFEFRHRISEDETGDPGAAGCRISVKWRTNRAIRQQFAYCCGKTEPPARSLRAVFHRGMGLPSMPGKISTSPYVVKSRMSASLRRKARSAARSAAGAADRYAEPTMKMRCVILPASQWMPKADCG